MGNSTSIVVNTNKYAYYPGDVVSGNVNIDLKEDRKITRVIIHVVGAEETKLTKGTRGLEVTDVTSHCLHLFSIRCSCLFQATSL